MTSMVPGLSFFLLKMDINILQMSWIYLYKELLPSGHVFWVGFFPLNTVIYTCLFI